MDKIQKLIYTDRYGDVKMINYDLIKIGDKLLTISLDPSLYNLKARAQLKRTVKIILGILYTITGRFTWCAELTKKDNVHYHVIYDPGTIENEMIIDAFKQVKNIGNTFINYKAITDEVERLRTFNYIFEDFLKSDSVINKKNTNYDICGQYECRPRYVLVQPTNLRPEVVNLDKNVIIFDE